MDATNCDQFVKCWSIINYFRLRYGKRMNISCILVEQYYVSCVCFLSNLKLLHRYILQRSRTHLSAFHSHHHHNYRIYFFLLHPLLPILILLYHTLLILLLQSHTLHTLSQINSMAKTYPVTTKKIRLIVIFIVRNPARDCFTIVT